MSSLQGHFSKRNASADRVHNGDEIPGYEPTSLDYQIISDVKDKWNENPIINRLNGNLKFDGSVNNGINPDDWYYDKNNEIQYRGQP